MSEEILLKKNEFSRKGTLQIIKDFWLLMKPELTLLSVFTSLCSAYIAIQLPDSSHVIIFFLLAFGTLFVGGGSGALNQYFEREQDALMKRTEKRPVPDARVTPIQALLFGFAISFVGIVLLALINWLSMLLAICTLATYVFLYTPLKRITSLATVIGAIPGALPTLIGWASIQGQLTTESLSLFAILFYWQMPHFYSIGWQYRTDYVNAGFKLLMSTDPEGKKLSRYVLINQIILTVIGISPAIVGLVSTEYIPIALAIGLLFLFFGLKFMETVPTNLSNMAARKLFFASLFYLPIIFSAMIYFKF